MSVNPPARRTSNDGRTERRLEAMRRVQAAALDLAEAHGLAAVTVEEIAARAGVGPATVYRNFSTKEGVILWDDYDPPLLDAIRARLGRAPALRAVADGVITALEAVYRVDRARILKRSRLLVTDSRLEAAGEPDRAALRAALAEALLATRAARTRLAADALAAASVAALQVAVTHWVEAAGRRPLGVFVRAAFDALAGAGSLAASTRPPRHR